jgi:hypothetical protein
MAAATGMLIYGMGLALSQGGLTITGLALLAAAGVVVYALTRRATVVGVIVLPLLLVQLALGQADRPLALFMAVLIGFIWYTQLRIALSQRLFRLAEPAREKLTRGRQTLR